MRESIKRLFDKILSPWLLLLFLLVPAYAMATILLGRGRPGEVLIVANNALLFSLLLLRLLVYVTRVRSRLRYPSAAGSRGRGPVGTIPKEEAGGLREKLIEQGYHEDGSGGYLEARDSGFWGSLTAHALIVLVIIIGSYDYTHYIAGSIRLGKGTPVPLYKTASFREFSTGWLASQEDLSFKLGVVEQYAPTKDNMLGEALVWIEDREGKELARERMVPGGRLSQGDFFIEFVGTGYDAWVVIREGGTHTLLAKFIALSPETGGPEGYLLHGSYEHGLTRTKAEVWMKPETKTIMVSATRDGEPIFDGAVFEFGSGHKEIFLNNMLVQIQGLATNTVLKVQRKRNFGLIKILGALALVALGLRIFVRPRRVWLVEEGEMVRVMATRPADVSRAL